MAGGTAILALTAVVAMGGGGEAAGVLPWYSSLASNVFVRPLRNTSAPVPPLT